MSNAFGIDLGTCNLKIYSRQDKKVHSCRNTIAVVSRDQMYACGDEAWSMFEKSPEAIDVSFPVSGGVISAFDYMQTMLFEILERDLHASVRRSEFLIAVPCDITEVEKKAFSDLFTRTKARPKSVRICEKPLAAALGVGVDIAEHSGALIIDIGADTTEISVVSPDGIVLSELLPWGGSRLDEAIVLSMRRLFGLVIGRRTAMQLKEELGSAQDGRDEKLSIVGRDVVSGLPVTFAAEAGMIRDGMREDLESFGASVRRVLEKVPPELAKDIVLAGIHLTGGGSRIHGIAPWLQELTGISVNVSDQGENAAAWGLGRMLTERRYAGLGEEIRTRMFR